MIDPLPLPYPLNLPEKWKIAALRAMTMAERHAIGCRLSDEYRRRWLRSLREFFPRATAAEFRQVVIDTLLAQAEEEREVAERCSRRKQEWEAKPREAGLSTLTP